MSHSSKLDRISSIVVMIAAVAVALAVVYRTFVPRTTSLGESRAPEKVSKEQWRQAVDAGIVIGGTREAPVTIVEFADLECPACRGYQPTLEEVVREHASLVRLMYVPYPLSYHRFALAAAKGGECAIAFGALAEWIHVLYSQQDSLGLKSWGGYASAAGISDTALISKCARDPRPVRRIESSLRLGEELGNIGTPTLIVEGEQYFSPPAKATLAAAIERAAKTGRPAAPDVSLVGSVFDSATSTPIHNATVALLDPRGVAVSSTRSNESGAFVVHAPNGLYRIRVAHDGHKTFEADRSTEFRGEVDPTVVFLARDPH